MADFDPHDPLCPWLAYDGECRCGLIEKVVEREYERWHNAALEDFEKFAERFR
jgi:hypothetical protein